MPNSTSILNTLIDVNDCMLILIDIQDSFLSKNPREEADRLLSRAGWLMEIAKILDVPIIATAEDIPEHGTMSTSLLEILPANYPVFNKMVFNLADDPQILEAVNASGRKTIVLVGLETDVCIAQSALGLIANGFNVVAVADAMLAPNTGQQFGLERMRTAGVLISSVKALYYEWVRTVEKTITMYQDHLKDIGEPLDTTF
ncbi:MAG: isochorismatase family protein [Anaerolineaceae bacterium]|nr:isochorismatase family protein [Anaerolineaceae bacterium]